MNVPGLPEVRFRRDGFRFRADARFDAAALEELLADLDGLPHREGVRLVKRNNVRTVLHVPLSGGAVYFKRYHVRGLAERLKYLLVPSRPVAEWRAARAMRAAGLPAVRALLMGEKRLLGILRDGCLATAAVEEALDLVPYIHRHFPGSSGEARRRHLLRLLARNVRLLHDRGFVHGDLHSGNLLVTGPPGDPRLHFIDLHTVRRRRRVGRRARFGNLAKLLHSLTSGTTDGDRLDLLRAYEGEEPGGLGPPEAVLPRLVRRVARLERRRVVSRTKRCLRRSGDYDHARMGPFLVRFRRGILPGAVLLAVGDHLLSAAGGGPEVLKDSRRSALSRQVLAAPEGWGRVVVKETRCRGAADLLKNAVRRPRALAAWVHGCGLSVRRVRAARPLACVLEGRWPRIRRGFLLMEDLSGRERLDLHVLSRWAGNLSPAERAEKVRFVRACGRWVGDLHRRGVYHGDLKAVNVYVGEDGRFTLVDYDRVRFGRRVGFRRRVKNLAQLAASIPVCITRTDRLRFFRAYAGDPETARRLAAFNRGVERACRRKIVVRMEPIE